MSRRNDIDRAAEPEAEQEAEILREYGPFPGAPQVGGVSFDGSLVWFAGGGRLQAFDPATGKSVRALEVAADAGTAFDGRHLFQLVAERINKIDPATGKIVSSIPAPGGGRDSGLTWAEGTLWVGQYRDRKIHQIDPATGAILRTIESNRFVTGVTWVDGELWHATLEDNESEIRRVDPKTGEVLTRLTLPEGAEVSGLEAGGGGSFVCGGRKKRPRESDTQATPPLTITSTSTFTITSTTTVAVPFTCTSTITGTTTFTGPDHSRDSQLPGASADRQSMLSFQRLDVYQRSIEFLAFVHGLELPKGHAELADQLRRSAQSIPQNIAEGVGRMTRLDKARHYTIARGSAMESAAHLDVMKVDGLVDDEPYREGIDLLERVVAMLTKLIDPRDR